MEHEAMHLVPLVQHAAEQAAAQHTQQRLTTPEEIRAADQLFAKQEQEAQLVSGLMGTYTGSLLLRDLAAEHLARDENEETDEREPDETEGETV